MVQARVFALPRQIIHNTTFEIKLSGLGTIADVLPALLMNDKEKRVFKQKGSEIELVLELAVLINGRNMNLQQGLATHVLDSDRISLIRALKRS